MKVTKKQASEMIRDGFKASIILGKNVYPSPDVNAAWYVLTDKWLIFSKLTELEPKTIVIFDNVWNVERYRFNKTSEGNYDTVPTK